MALVGDFQVQFRHASLIRRQKQSRLLLLLPLLVSLCPPALFLLVLPPVFRHVLRHTGSLGTGTASVPGTQPTSFGWTGHSLGWSGGRLWGGSQFPHEPQYWFLLCGGTQTHIQRGIDKNVFKRVSYSGKFMQHKACNSWHKQNGCKMLPEN